MVKFNLKRIKNWKKGLISFKKIGDEQKFFYPIKSINGKNKNKKKRRRKTLMFSFFGPLVPPSPEKWV